MGGLTLQAAPVSQSRALEVAKVVLAAQQPATKAAGDDNVRPVLALSQESDFAVEDMPSNVKWWMEQLKGFVRAQKVQTPQPGKRLSSKDRANLPCAAACRWPWPRSWSGSVLRLPEQEACRTIPILLSIRLRLT